MCADVDQLLRNLKIYFPEWDIPDNTFNRYKAFLSKFPIENLRQGMKWVILNISRKCVYIADIYAGMRSTGLKENWETIVKLKGGEDGEK